MDTLAKHKAERDGRSRVTMLSARRLSDNNVRREGSASDLQLGVVLSRDMWHPPTHLLSDDRWLLVSYLIYLPREGGRTLNSVKIAKISICNFIQFKKETELNNLKQRLNRFETRKKFYFLHNHFVRQKWMHTSKRMHIFPMNNITNVFYKIFGK